MMQAQWPGLGPSFDLSPLESPFGTGDGYGGSMNGSPRAHMPDGVARPWWTPGGGSGGVAGNGNDPFGTPVGGGNTATGSIGGILSGLVSLLQQLVGSFVGQSLSQTPGQTPCQTTPQRPYCATNGLQQRFENMDVSSTGDPHLAVVGTREGGGTAIDAHWDSMTSQNDLVHSTQIDGGYRVSTAVTQPGANGVTTNQSATVHAYFDQDAVTMNRDGSFAIFDNGNPVQLGKGESASLSGGETVSESQDGSLLVSARSATGGTIATTLRANGTGVDVTTHAHDIAVGGDAIIHASPGAGILHVPPRHEPAVMPPVTPMMPPAP